MRSMSTFYQNRVSTALSCWPTERHAHYWLNTEVCRGSEPQTPERDAAALRQRLRVCRGSEPQTPERDAAALRQRLRDALAHGATSQGGGERAAPKLRSQL